MTSDLTSAFDGIAHYALRKSTYTLLYFILLSDFESILGKWQTNGRHFRM